MKILVRNMLLKKKNNLENCKESKNNRDYHV